MLFLKEHKHTNSVACAFILYQEIDNIDCSLSFKILALPFGIYETSNRLQISSTSTLSWTE
jgi:hypothetical protein